MHTFAFPFGHRGPKEARCEALRSAKIDIVTVSKKDLSKLFCDYEKGL